jgi:6-phosphogluconolactonase
VSAVPDLRVLDTPEAVFAAAHDEFLARARAAIAASGRFVVSLAGGKTPEHVYASLVGADLDWSRCLFFFGDERCVPPTHSDSNYRMARAALLSKIAIPDRNVHRIFGEVDPPRAAEEYADEMRRVLDLAPKAVPRFDLALLGMGADGHTASLFPGSTALAVRDKLAASTWVEKLQAFRVTLTFPVFENAACVLFLVCGADKAQALKLATATTVTSDTPPSGRVRPTNGDLVWLVDREAASRP